MARTSVPTVPLGGAAGGGPPLGQGAARPQPTATYLRDTRSGVIAARPAVLREHRDDIRMAWRRAAALALDLIQNSGRLRGAADQVIADTVGVELALNPQPDPAVMARLGYSEEELTDFIRTVKARWKRWAWNPAECDARAKFTVPQMVDIGLRWNMAFGELTGVVEYWPRAQRARYGIATGTKVCMVPPSRLVQDTAPHDRLFQGVIHDDNGRPQFYRFAESADNLGIVKRDWPARDDAGRPVVLHIFDPVDATDVRGISVLAAAFRKYIQHEMLDDATLQTAVLQTVFAATLTSSLPSAEAFEALEALKASGNEDVAAQVALLIGSQIERAAESTLNISTDPQVSHLAPGEKLAMETAQTPGSQYLPFSKSLSRDTARAIGITYGAFTMDHENATYSSVRMENASIWPVVMRRRERIAGPQMQAIYEVWLDEEIGEGRLPFKGGYRAFAANRDAVAWAQWQGPAKPTADDQKSARAASERIDNGTSSLEIEAGELGHDAEELREQRWREHQWYVSRGMRSPYDRRGGGQAATREDVEEAVEERREAARG